MNTIIAIPGGGSLGWKPVCSVSTDQQDFTKSILPICCAFSQQESDLSSSEISLKSIVPISKCSDFSLARQVYSHILLHVSIKPSVSPSPSSYPISSPYCMSDAVAYEIAPWKIWHSRRFGCNSKRECQSNRSKIETPSHLIWKTQMLVDSSKLCGRFRDNSTFPFFDTERHLGTHKIDVPLDQIVLLWPFNPAKSGLVSPTRWLIQGKVNLPQLSEVRTFSQFFLIE
jgi:hypothetical protein